jgi:signal transduction histidine kinase
MNRKILFQVTAPALLPGLLLVGTCLLSAYSIHRLHSNLSSILSENVTSLQAALDLENSMRQLRYHSFLYLMKPTAASLRQIQQDEQGFQQALERAQTSANTETEQEHVRQIEAGFTRYKKEMARERAKVVRTGPIDDLAELATHHPIRHIVDPCKELGRLNREQLERTSQQSYELSSQARLVLLLIGLGGPVGGLLCGYGIVRGLTRSITRLSVRVRDVVERLEEPKPSASTPEPLDNQDIDLGSVTVAAEGDLGALDVQLQQVLRRVEEVTERLQRQHRDILRAEQLAAVGRLAAGVAHEVRNPLTGMKLLVEAGLRSAERSRQARGVPRAPFLSEEDLRVIHGEITRLEETVQNFLTFARPPSLRRQLVDLREPVRRALDLVRARARQSGVSIELDLPERPVPVSLDVGQFTPVLVNLLLNALDAMPHGGGLRLRAEEQSSPSEAERSWRLSVCDTGPGIAPAMAGRLFTPFVSTKPAGTGLGLSLSRRIVEEHGGQITGANRAPADGGGACFTILLPLASEGPVLQSATHNGPATQQP